MKRIPSLDGLRAISISLVVLGHLAYEGHSPKVLAQYANLGVRIFFVISGYLITTILLAEHSRTGTISLRDFYIRRAYRIFPAAMCFIFVAILLYWHTLRWYDIGAALLYLVNFDPVRPWVIGHLWSLSVEEQFYFLWPSVLKKWHRHRMMILWTVILAAPIARASFFFLKVAGGAYGNLLTVGDNLATGCLLAVLSARMPKVRWQAAGLMVGALVLIPFYDADTRLRTMFTLFVLSPLLHFSIAGILIHVVQHPLPPPQLGASRLARKHKLQPLSVAAAVPQSSVTHAVWGSMGRGAGLRFLLSGRETNASSPGPDRFGFQIQSRDDGGLREHDPVNIRARVYRAIPKYTLFDWHLDGGVGLHSHSMRSGASRHWRP